MKAGQVLKILRVSRPTLAKYVRSGHIKVVNLPSGRHEYIEESVYKFYNKDIERKTVLYARVSTNKQKKDLENQVELLKKWCFQKGEKIDEIYMDVASGVSFEKRDEFFKMMTEIIDKKVQKVIITYKDRLSRVGFELFKHLFESFNCKIEVISEVGSQKLDSEEIFEEIISLLHCYSMKLYSKRRIKQIQEICQPE